MSDGSAAVPLLITLLVVAVIGFSITGTLYVLRRRKSTASLLPTHVTVTAVPYSDNEKRYSTITTTTTTTTNIPEIRITFPEEEGPDGKRKSGRVVVVQVGEAGAAFVRDIVEPTTISKGEDRSEGLPSYKQTQSSPIKSEFDSVDLDKVGGLKEKHNWV